MFYNFFSEAGARGARSTALHALQWGMGMLLCSIPLSLAAKAPTWILIVLVAALGLLFLTFVGSYIFLLSKNPDALRSESYTLSKMAIERGLIGDSGTGLMELTETGQQGTRPQPLISTQGGDNP
jgi:hypothetical protein